MGRAYYIDYAGRASLFTYFDKNDIGRYRASFLTWNLELQEVQERQKARAGGI